MVVKISGAKNYAGNAVNAYAAEVKVEKAPGDLTVAQELNLEYGKTDTIKITMENGAGRTVSVSADSAILSLSDTSLILDENGSATLTVTANLPGTETLIFTPEGTGTTTKTTVNVSISVKHDLIKTAAKAATCTEAGNVEYYTCSVCKKTFSDAKGTKAITDVTVKAAGHKLTKTAAKAATCTTAGNVEYYTCSVCKKTFSDAKGTKAITDVTVKATGHKLTKTAAKAAT